MIPGIPVCVSTRRIELSSEEAFKEQLMDVIQSGAEEALERLLDNHKEISVYLRSECAQTAAKLAQWDMNQWNLVTDLLNNGRIDKTARTNLSKLAELASREDIQTRLTDTQQKWRSFS